MQRSLREVLDRSHVAPVMVALLLAWTLYAIVDAMYEPLGGTLTFIATAIAILDIPSHSAGWDFWDRTMLIHAVVAFYTAMVAFSAAWFLSRWMYNQSPVRSLARYYKQAHWRNHV